MSDTTNLAAARLQIVDGLKDTAAESGSLRDRDSGELMSVGVASAAVEVFADKNAFSKLREPDSDMFANRPDTIEVTLSNGNSIIFPVEFMAATAQSVDCRNLQLGITLVIPNGTLPSFSYPRVGGGGVTGSGADAVKKIKV